MAFQILNSENKPIPLSTLDAEAAALWNQPVDASDYATPTGKWNVPNWYDVIGWNISRPNTNWTSGWDNIKCSIYSIHSVDLPLKKDEQAQLEDIQRINRFVKPYFDLIDHWSNKGYVPKQVSE